MTEYQILEIRPYVHLYSGRSTGECYVKLEDITRASEALAVLNKAFMGNRYLE